VRPSVTEVIMLIRGCAPAASAAPGRGLPRR
jgi:hypothetical protein